MDFDTVNIQKSGNSLLMTADEFLELPASDRTSLIAAGQVEFIKEGKPLSNKETLERVKAMAKSSYLAVLNGATAPAKRIHLVSTTTSLSKTGKQTGAIVLSPEGYVLKRIGGAGDLLLNGKIVPTAGVVLAQGDVIEVTGTRLQFFG